MINIYCDESCHLENDRQKIMLFGALWCPKDYVECLSSKIEALKIQYHTTGEMKWNKVSPAKQQFYLDVTNFFLKEDNIYFRSVVVLHKDMLNHQKFNRGSHDDFYYKMYFLLLEKILSPKQQYNIYLDIKDSRSGTKLKVLKEILCNDKHDFSNKMIRQLQSIRSEESHLMQLCDLLLGAVSYRIRGLYGNKAKLAMINYIEQYLGRELLYQTSIEEEKFNIFLFTPQEK